MSKAFSVTHLSSTPSDPNEAYAADGDGASLIQRPFELCFARSRCKASAIRSSATPTLVMALRALSML